MVNRCRSHIDRFGWRRRKKNATQAKCARADIVWSVGERGVDDRRCRVFKTTPITTNRRQCHTSPSDGVCNACVARIFSFFLSLVICSHQIVRCKNTAKTHVSSIKSKFMSIKIEITSSASDFNAKIEQIASHVAPKNAQPASKRKNSKHQSKSIGVAFLHQKSKQFDKLTTK
jgi:hypothetical protein